MKFSQTKRRSISRSTDCSLIELDSRIAPKNIWVGVFYKVEKNIFQSAYILLSRSGYAKQTIFLAWPGRKLFSTS